MPRTKILWIDDRPNMVLNSTRDHISMSHPSVEIIHAKDIPTAEKIIKRKKPNAVVSDISLGYESYGKHGTVLQFFKHLEQTHPELHLAISSGLPPSTKIPGVHTFYYLGDYINQVKQFVSLVQRQPRRDAPPPRTIREPAPLKVLYADDDATYSSEVRRHLKARLGKRIQLTRVNNIHGALEHLKTKPVDVLISDINIGEVPMVENIHEIIDKMPKRFSSGVEFLAYAQKEFGIRPVALSGACFPQLDQPPGIDFIEKPLLEPRSSSYLASMLRRLWRYKNRPANRFRLLLIEPNSAQAKAIKTEIRDRFGKSVQITHIPSTNEGYNHLAKKEFHAVVAAPEKGYENQLGFLPNLQHQFQTPVIVHSDKVDQPEMQAELKESDLVSFNRTTEGKQQLLNHMTSLVNRFNPQRSGQTINLDAIAAIGPVLHTSADGKQELIELVKRSGPEDVKVAMIRSGKRYPLTTIAFLESSPKNLTTRLA